MSENILNTETSHQETLLEFPCQFPIKIFGKTEQGFAEAMLSLVQQYAPEVTMAQMKIQNSRGKKYCAITITIKAESKAQLDQIYQAITQDKQVVMAL